VSDIDTAVVVDSLKALDREWPIREADIFSQAVSVVMGQERHFALRKSNSPFRHPTTVKSITDLPFEV
jgi:hypothetical protein